MLVDDKKDVLFLKDVKITEESKVELILMHEGKETKFELARNTENMLQELKDALKKLTGQEPTEIMCVLGEGKDSIPIRTSVEVAQLSSLVKLKVN